MHTRRCCLSVCLHLHDERTTGNTNKETNNTQTGRTVDGTSQGSGDTGRTQDQSKQDASTKLVTQRSQDESHQNGSSHTHNAGCPDLLLVQVQSHTNLGQQRGDGKPNEEGNEESPPTAVKGTHMGTCKAAEFDLGRLEILIGIDDDMELIVLFPDAGLSDFMRARSKDQARKAVEKAEKEKQKSNDV